MPVTVPPGASVITGPTGNPTTIRGTGDAPGYDPSGTFVGQMLGILNSPGQYVGGSGGGILSAAPQRAASQAGYNQASADAQKIYGQATSLVAGRDPGIQQSYTDATAALQANVRQRAIDDMGRQQALQQQAINGAQALGLSGVASPSATTRTNNQDAANQAKYQTNADTWAGFNSGAAQRAVAKNDAVSNSFAYSGTQAQASLAALLQKTLASEQDKVMKGSAGKFIGLTPQQQFAGYNSLLGYTNKDANTSLNVSKAQNSAASQTFKNNLAQKIAQAKYNVSPAPAAQVPSYLIHRQGG